VRIFPQIHANLVEISSFFQRRDQKNALQNIYVLQRALLVSAGCGRITCRSPLYTGIPLKIGEQKLIRAK